jgi:hypothetical protein
MKDGQPDMETGEIAQSHPLWPVQFGLRQIQIIAGTLVGDMRCERVDIPLGHNVNIPIPYTPYGQGEPERLEPLQEAYNNCLSDIINAGDYCANPAKVILESVHKSNKALASTAFTSPGATFPVDDKVAAQAGGLKNVIAAVDVPQLGADAWQRLRMLDEAFDKESDQSQILRGQLPGQSALSGNAIGQLQGAAKTSIVFKSGRTEDMLKYVAKIMLGDIVTRMTANDLADEIRKYPRPVWYELHRRLQQGYLDCEIVVEISSGGSAANSAETQQMIAASGESVPFSPQTLIERMGGDPDAELQKMASWQRKLQQAQQQQQVPSGVAAQPPSGVSAQAQPQQVPQPQQQPGAPVGVAQ